MLLSSPSQANQVEDLSGESPGTPELVPNTPTPEPHSEGSNAATEASPLGANEDEEDEPDPNALPTNIPFAEDLRGGRILLTLAPELIFPLGNPAGSAWDSFGGLGWGLSASVGYQLQRNIAIALGGDFNRLGGDGSCDECQLSGYSIRGYVTYFMSQGLRFDPYASLGVGLRNTSFELAQNASGVSYSALAVKALVGGDWLVNTNLRVGPYAGVDWFRYFADEFGSPKNAWQLLFGVRLGLQL